MWLEVLKELHDAVLVSNPWSDDEQHTAETAAMLMYEFAFEGVRPGGLLFVHDSIRDANTILSESIESSGFSVVQRISYANSRIIVGQKPFTHHPRFRLDQMDAHGSHASMAYRQRAAIR